MGEVGGVDLPGWELWEGRRLQSGRIGNRELMQRGGTSEDLWKIAFWGKPGEHQAVRKTARVMCCNMIEGGIYRLSLATMQYRSRRQATHTNHSEFVVASRRERR